MKKIIFNNKREGMSPYEEPENLLNLVRAPTFIPSAPTFNIPIPKPPVIKYNINVKYMDFEYNGDIRLLKRTLKLIRKNLNPLLQSTVKRINEATNGLDEIPENAEYDGMEYV